MQKKAYSLFNVVVVLFSPNILFIFFLEYIIRVFLQGVRRKLYVFFEAR